MSWDEVDSSVKSKNAYFQVQDGENKVRIVSEPAVVRTHWKDKKPYNCLGEKCALCGDSDEQVARVNVTFMFHVIDRSTGEFAVGEFKPSVAKQVREFQKTGEYAYEGDIAPYDITIKKSGKGLDTEYKVIPARSNSELTDAEKEKVATLKNIKEIRDALVAKRGGQSAAATPVSEDPFAG